jgi:hypothetical protein
MPAGSPKPGERWWNEDSEFVLVTHRYGRVVRFVDKSDCAFRYPLGVPEDHGADPGGSFLSTYSFLVMPLVGTTWDFYADSNINIEYISKGYSDLKIPKPEDKPYRTVRVLSDFGPGFLNVYDESIGVETTVMLQELLLTAHYREIITIWDRMLAEVDY